MFKKIIIIISLFLFIGALTPYSFAKDSSSSKGTNSDINCKDVSSSENSGGFYVILEEPIGGPDAKYCFRVCSILDPNKPGTKVNKCKIQDSCDTAGDKDLGKTSCQRIQVIKADSGSDLIYKYVRMIYLWAVGTIGIISVFTLVYSGIGISMAGGDSGKIDNYKNRIMQSLTGLVILFLSGLILYTINPTFFV
ncbi:hypothetical protein J7J83_04120 [bacterium]|nr:hypothetical protein [bacterium]